LLTLVITVALIVNFFLARQLRSPNGNRLFREATLAFNQNLNCIIGPRGSGKTTVIEALRYALGCNKMFEEVASRSSNELSRHRRWNSGR
jgi:predicted ATP-binding protein involved in virulence